MDEQIVIRAQRGDREAFGLLVEATADTLHAIAQGVLRDISLAEDAVQQALLQNWRDLPRLRDPARFEAWAYRVTARTCYSEARRARQAMHGHVDLARPDADADAPDVVSQVIDRDQLERAFGRSSLDHRTVVVMRHYLEMPLERPWPGRDAGIHGRRHHGRRLVPARRGSTPCHGIAEVRADGVEQYLDGMCVFGVAVGLDELVWVTAADHGATDDISSPAIYVITPSGSREGDRGT